MKIIGWLILRLLFAVVKLVLIVCVGFPLLIVGGILLIADEDLAELLMRGVVNCMEWTPFESPTKGSEP